MVPRQAHCKPQYPRHRLHPIQRHCVNLAKAYNLDASVERAKAYISGCLSAMLDLGHGSGP